MWTNTREIRSSKQAERYNTHVDISMSKFFFSKPKREKKKKKRENKNEKSLFRSTNNRWKTVFPHGNAYGNGSRCITTTFVLHARQVLGGGEAAGGVLDARLRTFRASVSDETRAAHLIRTNSVFVLHRIVCDCTQYGFEM